MPTNIHLRIASGVDREIHRRASGVIYTSYIDLENATREYGIERRQGLVVRNGVEDDVFSSLSTRCSATPTIVYGGNLYVGPEAHRQKLAFLDRLYARKIRYSYDTYSLIPLLRAVQRARVSFRRDIQVEVFGGIDRSMLSTSLGLAGAPSDAKWARNFGLVDKHTLSKRYHSAAALYLPVPGRADGKPCGWLPQKTFEVLAGDRPVVVSAPPSGEARTLLRSRRGVFFLDGPPDEDASRLVAAIDSGSHPRPKSRWRRSSQAMQVEAFACSFLPGGTRAQRKT